MDGRCETPLSSWKKIQARWLRAFFYFRPPLFEPELHLLCISLASLFGRPLRGPVHCAQNLPHMTGVILDAGHPFYNLCHAWQRPKIRLEAVGLCSTAHSLLQLPKLLRFQLRFATGSARALEGASSSLFPFCVPSAHALPAHLQFTSHRGQNHFAGREQAARLFPPPLQFRKVAAWTNSLRHTSSITASEANVSLYSARVSLYYASLSRSSLRASRDIAGFPGRRRKPIRKLRFRWISAPKYVFNGNLDS